MKNTALPAHEPEKFFCRRWNLRRLSSLVGPLFFCAALFVLHRSAESFRMHDVVAFIEALPYAKISGAFALVGVNFLLFPCYDLLALRYIGKNVSLKKVVGTSMLAFSFSNVVGGMVIGGGGIRYRSYGNAGLSAVDILRVSLFIWISWLVGVAALFGVTACAFPHLLDPLQWRYLPDLRWFGLPMLLGSLIYLVLAGRRKGVLTLRGMKWSVPGLPLALEQIAVVGVDLLLSSYILYLLIPFGAAVAFPRFAAVFVLAIILSLFSGSPGGLGVFEVLMLHLLRDRIGAPDLLGALMVFRLIYYLLPLSAGAVVLGGIEARRWLHPLRPVGELTTDWIRQAVPQAFSLAALAAGTVMLMTGTLPLNSAQMNWISNVIPLGLFETSHFLASVVGLLLVLFSRELHRRQYGAYAAVLVLLIVGVLVEIVKGHVVFSLLGYGGLLLALLPCRKSFTRHSVLFSESFNTSWLLTCLLVVGAAIWLVFFNYRHVEYSSELWWRFSLTGNASRAMRATAGAMVVLLFSGLRRLLHPPRIRPHVPTEEELALLRPIVFSSHCQTAPLVLLRDKSVLFSPSRQSFLMYAVANRVWVCMGNPVGRPEEFRELVWQFRELSDRFGGRPVFYQIGEEHMSLYVEAGFNLFKLGEEALIPLEGYSLEGADRAKLRYVHRRMEKEGYTFEVCPREEVPSLLPRLRTISDMWLEDKDGREKGFSLGCFDDGYMQEFPVALVRDAEGNIAAFANLWPGDGYTELSMDLMRYLPGAPSGIMDYLFTSLFLWGSAQGYRSFNMGMAPLAGLEDHPLSSFWTRMGIWVYRNGEHFYNFQGLRRYKDKFNPEWHPRYLASLGGPQLTAELFAITTLISGGAERPKTKCRRKEAGSLEAKTEQRNSRVLM